MTIEMICAGFGGQGVLTIGKFIAQELCRRKNVSWLPSYGPEMREWNCQCFYGGFYGTYCFSNCQFP